MKTYNRINFSQISEILMQAAIGVSAVSGNKWCVSDMVYSLAQLSNETRGRLEKPFYIAIQELGTESGAKEHCIKRCKGLGYLFIIAKIEENVMTGYNMTIMFTHNPYGDNTYMEQEFEF